MDPRVLNAIMSLLNEMIFVYQASLSGHPILYPSFFGSSVSRHSLLPRFASTIVKNFEIYLRRNLLTTALTVFATVSNLFPLFIILNPPPFPVNKK